jgi:hypothetical protein
MSKGEVLKREEARERHERISEKNGRISREKEKQSDTLQAKQT